MHRLVPTSLIFLVAAFVALSVQGVTPRTAMAQETITIFPDAPTVNNSHPFGRGVVWTPFVAFFYRDVPAFDLEVGDTLAFDLGQPNDFSQQLDIALARTTVNGGIQEAEPFVTVVTNTQTPPSMGDTTTRT